MNVLHPQIERELRTAQAEVEAKGFLLSPSRLQENYDAFRRQFAPDILRVLDGEELLERMHDHGNKDSLVYWLEFKNDETFSSSFGSIRGGSALKFGVYRRAESGSWAGKGVGSAPKDIPITDAIAIARKHRDQLVAASDVLSAFPLTIEDKDYLALQRDLTRVAPDVEDTAWGHKYLSLLHSEKLDDYHVESYQRYHLTRLLQLPPRDETGWAAGRYVCAGRFVELTRDLGLPLHEVTTILNQRNGEPRSYWRVDASDDVRDPLRDWAAMRDQSIVAVGWPKVGDLSGQLENPDAKENIAALVRSKYPGSDKAIAVAVNQLLKFVARYNVGDRIVVANGDSILGVGEVTGPYIFDPASSLPHQRPVKWKSLLEWREAELESRRSSLGSIKDPPNQVLIERHIVDDAASASAYQTLPKAVHEATPVSRARALAALTRLGGPLARVQEVLERKGQVVLYGPPGTGKTHWALRGARDLASLRTFDILYDALTDSQKQAINTGTSEHGKLVRTVSFHPEYGYEDFIEGYRPHAAPSGALSFTLVAGIFKQLCDDAIRSPQLDFYLIIDEINRGDIPRIFGELLTLLERNKRGEAVQLPASGEAFHVPSNVYVIGTMNTADRSIALLDVALRRRFGFVELMPDYSLLSGVTIGEIPLSTWLQELNKRVRATGGGDARNRQVGHSFLMGSSGTAITTVEQFSAVLRDDIIPLLQEYSYDDFAQFEAMLGSSLVDTKAQNVRYDLFEPGRGAELLAALNRPEIATAVAAITARSDGLLGDEDSEINERNDANDSNERDAEPIS